MNNGKEFFRVVKEETDTVLEIYGERTVRPVSGAAIVKTAEDCITVKVKAKAILRIGDYLYVWDAEKHVLEPQC